MNNPMNIINSNYNINNNIEDPLYYIKEKKILIKFINSDNKIFNVMIPISLTKNDLYSIAKLYKVLTNSNIILSYNNCILKKDNSSIEEIQDGSIINIVEERNYPYDIFNKYNNNINNIFIQLYLQNGKNKIIYVSEDTTISELINGIYSLLGTNEKSIIIFNYNSYSDILKIKEKNVKDIAENKRLILKIEQLGDVKQRERFGKIINAEVIFKNISQSNEEINPIIIQTGTLESTKSLFESINNMLCSPTIKIKKLYINEEEINENEEKSLLSIGIKEDFNILAIIVIK